MKRFSRTVSPHSFALCSCIHGVHSSNAFTVHHWLCAAVTLCCQASHWSHVHKKLTFLWLTEGLQWNMHKHFLQQNFLLVSLCVSLSLLSTTGENIWVWTTIDFIIRELRNQTPETTEDQSWKYPYTLSSFTTFSPTSWSSTLSLALASNWCPPLHCH